MIRRPPRSTLFPTRRSSDLYGVSVTGALLVDTILMLLVARVLWRWSAAKDRKSTRLNSSHQIISYAVFCLKKKRNQVKDPSPKERTTAGHDQRAELVAHGST